MEQLLTSADSFDTIKLEIIEYADKIVTTINPAVLPDGSDIDDAPAAKTDPHICNEAYSSVTDFHEDLSDLCHTRCSTAYCLRTHNGRQKCRFGYPKPLQSHTTIFTDEEPTLLHVMTVWSTAPTLQLSAWRANVDMQYIISRRKVVEYCTKYVTKSEPRSEHLQQDERATVPSTLDHYIVRPATSHFNTITLLEFAQQYAIPKELSAEPKQRSKKVVVIARPYCSTDPDYPNYEQYCHQTLMQHKSFRQMSELLAGCETYAEAYATFLLTGNIPQSLESDILRVQQNTDEQSEHVHTGVC